MYWIIWSIIFLSGLPRIWSQKSVSKGQELFFKHCVVCHHPGGSAPFSMTDYSQIIRFKSMISHVVDSKWMPPWQPDDSYQQYKHSRQLEISERQQIIDWVNTLQKKEKLLDWKRLYLKQKKVNKKKCIVLEHPDGLEVAINARDTIIPFEFPYKIDSDKNIQQIEFYCSNLSIVHHANYFVVNAEKARGKKATVMNENFLSNNDIALGYAPGNRQLPFDEGCGFLLPAEGKVVGDIHISPSFKKEKLSFGLRLYTTDKPIQQRLFLQTVARLQKVNYDEFVIEADSQAFFKAYYTLSESVIVYYTHPHMHVFGKQFKSYALTPQQDTIPIVKINEWRFWDQQYYQFEKPLFLPKGSRIYYEAMYDNTSNNPLNPFNPPIQITEGWSIHQEMMANFLICAFPSTR